MERYNLIKVDRPDNIKRGGVFKKRLALRKIELCYITECLLCEVNVKGHLGFIIVSYRSPNQTSPQFDNFCRILRNSLMMFRSFNQPLQSF